MIRFYTETFLSSLLVCFFKVCLSCLCPINQFMFQLNRQYESNRKFHYFFTLCLCLFLSVSVCLSVCLCIFCLFSPLSFSHFLPHSHFQSVYSINHIQTDQVTPDRKLFNNQQHNLDQTKYSSINISQLIQFLIIKKKGK